MLEATMAASAGSERGHAALVGVVTVKVDVLAASSKALLHANRVGIAETRDLRDAELPAELGNERHWGEAVEIRVRETEIEDCSGSRARACDATKSQSPIASSSNSPLCPVVTCLVPVSPCCVPVCPHAVLPS